jgi:uncharacterized protein
MKQNIVYIMLVMLLGISCSKQVKKDYIIKPVPFTQIKVKDSFWSKRLNTNREVTIPFAFDKSEEEGRIRNFERAAGMLDGKYEGYMPFDDSDIYKIIEGASYSLQTDPDEKLDAYIDEIITKIAAAQEEDGYICTWKTIDPDISPAKWLKAGPRWFDLRRSHELYNVGHMYEAAYAHYRATGKRNFLDIALKNADLIDQTFGWDKRLEVPGHQIIETGLIKLYRATGNEKYLNLSKYFLDARGRKDKRELYLDYGDHIYSQDHLPVVEQNEAVGHAVRATYMYAGMVDIAALMQDPEYLAASDNLWENVVSKKLYLTGGIGGSISGEAFSDNYDLPNLKAYSETCASIAMVYWNHRMFLLKGDSRYIDVLERTLYNGLIAGVSLKGDSFFYPNCLASDANFKFNQGAATRSTWFDCSCCPSNIIRFMPSIPDYMYAVKDNQLYVNLFVSSSSTVSVDNQEIAIKQTSNYPWDGDIKIEVNPVKKKKFNILIRIPGWANNQPLPSDLYRYLENNQNTVQLSVNNEQVLVKIDKGFAVIDREWTKGDVIELQLPMPVRRVLSHENVQANHGKIAIERGPIVYCAEGIDNGGHALNLEISDQTEFSHQYQPELLDGVTVIQGRDTKTGKALKMIPYYAWSHRGVGEMAVWMNTKNLLSSKK